MQQPLFLSGEIDLRRKDAPDVSRANIITKLFIPGLSYFSVNHNPGGGIGAVDFNLPRIEALEPKAEFKGDDHELRALVGQHTTWTFAASMRKLPKNEWVAYRGEIEGSISQWEPDEMGAEEFKGFNLTFKEVTRLVVTADNQELLYWDWFEREMRPDPQFAAARRALGA